MSEHIDLENDELREVTQIAYDRTGKRPSPATTWRWIRGDIRGGKLEAVFIYGKWHTTAAAFANFIRRQTEAAIAAGEDQER